MILDFQNSFNRVEFLNQDSPADQFKILIALVFFNPMYFLIMTVKNLVNKQISNEYKNSLSAITKKNILEQIEKLHSFDLPPNLIDQEVKIISQSQKKEDLEKNKEKNKSLATSRIKTGLVLNEIAEKNNLKIGENEIKQEIEKQIKGMPGQEKMIMEYYQKNPSAVASLRGALYEEKILDLIKGKITLNIKKLTTKEAEELLKNFAQKSKVKTGSDNTKKEQKKSKIKKKKQKKLAKSLLKLYKRYCNDSKD